MALVPPRPQVPSVHILFIVHLLRPSLAASCVPSAEPPRRTRVWTQRGGVGGTQLWVLSPRPWCAPSLALSSLSKHTEAVVYYKKALELDPDNETYKSNLRIAELKLREAPSPVSRPRE